MSAGTEAPPGALPAARGARWPLRAMALLFAALGIVPTANYLTLNESHRWWAVAVHQWLLAGVVVGGGVLAFARFAPRLGEAIVLRLRTRLLAPSPRVFAWGIAAFAGAMTLLFSWLLFHFRAATIDELSELWQAHLLASGHLTARAELHPEFFSTMQTVQLDGRWFSHFPIGGPALQAIGLLLHVPWLINPLLAGAGAAAVYRVCVAAAGETQARITALLFALSPFVLFTAASKLDHVGTMAAIWLALAAVIGWSRATAQGDVVRSAAIVGLGLGIATAIRPYDGLLATVAIGVYQLGTAGRSRPHWRSLLVQALAGALPIAALLAANRAMTGHPLTFAYDVLNGPDHRPGFHMSPLGFEHTPRHGVYLLSTYLMRLSPALLAWPVPAVGLAALALALHRRVSRTDLLLVGVLATSLAGYFLYWGEGSFNGPRFLYVTAPVFLLFVARLPHLLAERAPTPWLQTAARLLIPACLLVAWLSPAGTVQPFGVWTLAMRARQDEVVSTLIPDAARRLRLSHAVVFVADGWHARLSARLRALGAPPFLAQIMVGRYDACAIQQRLDDAEWSGAPAARQADYVFALLEAQPTAVPVRGLPALEQLALDPRRPMPASCRNEMERALAHGADLARLLPLVALDSLGRPDGDVVYARDFGERNELLRPRFPDRAWYTARSVVSGDTLGVVLEPYRRPVTPSPTR